MQTASLLKPLRAEPLPPASSSSAPWSAAEKGAAPDAAAARLLQAAREAAEAGDARAQFNLGVMYLAGSHGCRRSIPDALHFFSAASTQGHGLALANLGAMHDEGLGVRASAAEAHTLWAKAAKQGVPQAQFNLGLYAETGRGGAVDLDAALRWYDAAASAGHAAALANLGALFDDGRGVDPDPDRAGRLYQLAAAKGHATAAFNLACLHREGRLTPPAQPPPPRRHAEAATLAGALPLADQAGSEQGTEPFLGSYDGGAEAGRWLRRAAELGLGRWGVRRRLFARWRRRWAVWIAVAVGLALEHTALVATLGARWSALLAVSPLLVGAAVAAVAARLGQTAPAGPPPSASLRLSNGPRRKARKD